MIPILIPAYEPDERLLKLLEDIIRQDLYCVIVNDGSSDEYKCIFDKAGEMLGERGQILGYPENHGKGYALKYGFKWIIDNMSEVCGVVTADSDGQHSISDIMAVAGELKEHPNCLIMGCRAFDTDDVPIKSRVGNTFMLFATRFCCGVKVSDAQSGLRGIPAEFMAGLLDIRSNRFEFETQMLAATRGKYPIRELTIETIYDSKENHQTHYRPFRDSVKIGIILLGELIRYSISSLSSSVIDLLLFSLFCKMLKTSDGVFYVTAATIMARIVSASYNYLINYNFVFKSRASKSRSFGKYVLLAVFTMLMSALFTTLGTGLFGSVSEVVIKIVVDVVLFFFNYKMQQTFVYSK